MSAVGSFLQFFQPGMGIKLEKLLKNAIVTLRWIFCIQIKNSDTFITIDIDFFYWAAVDRKGII